jgi:DNA helicase-2/ATP-dependent DNA helicase PcrA
MDFLEELNESQREAVINFQGPTMVIAGAGSGKTRVLTFRIAYLIKHGVDPFAILALTFTNKAAREMKDRISRIVGDGESQNIWMGTFHSVFARILRIESDKIGYPRNFSIYDTADSRNLIKNIIKELDLDDKIYKPNLVHGRISSAKNNLIGPPAYANNEEILLEDKQSAKPRLAEIYAMYDKRLFQSGAMDFDDLLFKTNILLRDHPDTLYKYQHRFQYILVDEYQDTNYAQYLIVKKLAALHENLCVVGDDAQSIYAFRGANIQNILSFKSDYPDYKIFKLEQNYRSTQNIVNAANSIISKNKDQIRKNVWTDNAEGSKIKLIGTQTDNEEGKVISERIHDTLHQENANYKDFAILYRTNAQSRAFEESLRKKNIPYRIYGGLSFYQRKEIKDLVAYFRLTANHQDEESFRRVINYPKRGIGSTTLDQMVIAANEHAKSLWEISDMPEMYQLKLSPAARKGLFDFTTMIKSFRSEMDKKNAYDLGHHIATSTGFLKDLYDDRSPEGISRYENVQELLNGMKEFCDGAPEGDVRYLNDFLLDVALLTDADNDKDEDNDKVALMTIHAAKGLEFPYVFIVGMEENLFPSQLSLHSRPELEEERRLFYVAITRAEKVATLSYARTRYRWGTLIHCEPSRFIEEIDPAFIEETSSPKAEPLGAFFDEIPWNSPFANKFPKAQGAAPRKSVDQKPESRPAAKPAFSSPPEGNLKKVSATSGGGAVNPGIDVGVSVIHEKFGKGKVVKMEGNAPDTKATIYFPNAGQKVILLKFAKLEIVPE